MADELDVLLEKIGDPGLRAEIRTAVDKVRAKRSFGLVFESHLPERVRLPDHPVRRGTTVARRGDKANTPLKVAAVRRDEATVLAYDGARETVPVKDLVVVAEFGEPVYPGLESVGGIRRGGDKPSHVVINAENHHALEMLQFTHAGKVDCIYIDPPYNTGAKDWKYDNDYVDGEDAYRHSKWLAFMERRLLLAKQLLNPEDSVLIVTIDEKEFLRLGLLLQQTFPSASHQMVSIRINPSGVARLGDFRRSDEFAFFVRLGAQIPAPVSLGSHWELDGARGVTETLAWNKLRRTGTNSLRADRPNLFYPLFVDPQRSEIVQVGEPISLTADRGEAADSPSGTVAVWPIREDGTEGNWQIGPDATRRLISKGYVQLGKANARGYAVYYLKSGEQQKIESGYFRKVGNRPDGSVIVERNEGQTRGTLPTTQWVSASHDSATHGSRLLLSMLPGRRFPFPKSLYAVEDAVRFFVKEKPRAVVLDFFAGSGTTAHAVMRLNRQDGGRRQAVVVTNNEVSVDEAKSLTARGLNDGDPEWEALGIFEHITRPRITAAVTGLTPDGVPIRGDYKFTDEFPMAEGFEENVEFMKLTYLDPVDVELDRAFAAVAPMLWLRAGGQGTMVSERTDAHGDLRSFAVTDRYGVLFQPDRWRDFSESLPASATTAFVVTDSAAVFAGVAESLRSDLEVVRLYENYLTTFAINRGQVS